MRVRFPVKGNRKADPERIRLVGWVVLKLESRDARGWHPCLFGPRARRDNRPKLSGGGFVERLALRGTAVQHLVERLRCLYTVGLLDQLAALVRGLLYF
jgi:hypothetical protein